MTATLAQLVTPDFCALSVHPIFLRGSTQHPMKVLVIPGLLSRQNAIMFQTENDLLHRQLPLADHP